VQLIKKALPLGNISVKAKLQDGTVLGIHVNPYGVNRIAGHFINGKSLLRNHRKQKLIGKYIETWKTMLEFSKT
jgi:hypothetical protein